MQETNETLEETLEETRVSTKLLDCLLDDAQTSYTVFFDKYMVVAYKLPNSFVVTGEAAVVDPKYFDLHTGFKVARESAKSKLWQLECYLLQEKKLVDLGVVETP